MDDLSLRRTQLIDYTNSLFREGLVDEQFTQLQMLQDETNPNFVIEVVSIFFNDCERLVDNMEKALEPTNVDFGVVDSQVHQLKGSGSSIGAARIKKACVTFKSYCEDRNREGCFRCLRQVKHEYGEFKDKLQSFFVLEQQYAAAGGSVPVLP